jgi:tetratricopeptide (TPR) repeat protein
LQSDRGGLDEQFWRWATYALRFALGHLNAGLGVAEALSYAEQLENDANWVIAAWDVRRAYHMRQGDWREAERCRDRIERLRVQSVRRPPMVDTSARLELDTCAHAGDLLGVRRAIARLEPLIELHTGYKVYAHYGPAMVEFLRGNYELALDHLDRALAMVQPGRHPTWAWIAGSRIEVLMHLGREEEAKRAGLRYMEEGTAAGLLEMRDHLNVPLALAEAKLGEYDAALERLDETIRTREELGSTGLNLGWAYETRARVAIWMRDQAGFVRASAACGREYGHGRGGSTFAPKYEALRAEARQAGLTSASELPPPAPADSVASYLSTLSGNTAVEDRMVLALTLIVSASGAKSGALYRIHAGPHGGRNHESLSVERCACTYEGAFPEQAPAWVSSVLSTALTDDDATEDMPAGELVPKKEGPGRWLPIALGCKRTGRYERTGAALLWFERGAIPKAISAELIEVVGHLLGS